MYVLSKSQPPTANRQPPTAEQGARFTSEIGNLTGVGGPDETLKRTPSHQVFSVSECEVKPKCLIEFKHQILWDLSNCRS